MKNLKYTLLSSGIMVAADLAATGSNVAIPLIGEIGIGTAVAIVVFLSEAYQSKDILRSFVLAVAAALLISIPGPIAGIGAAAYSIWKR